VLPQHLDRCGPGGDVNGQAGGSRWPAVLDDPGLVSELRDFFDYAQVGA
jgi:hypothetical protein